MLQKQSGLHTGSITTLLGNAVVDGVDLESLTYQENVLDNPLIITRAALYIYLNAVVCYAHGKSTVSLIRNSLLEDHFMTT